MKINIQSFGDIITNSSSEIYCLYSQRGTRQIKDSIIELVKTLRPAINIEDHLDIHLDLSGDHYFDTRESYGNAEQYYQEKFNEWAEDKSNEEVLAKLPAFKNQLLLDLENNYYNEPGSLDLVIKAKTELGEVLRRTIFGILCAYEYDEIYT